jgi:hypothetical protein
MAETIKRKCNQCKKEILVERNNMRGPVLYKGIYYHSNCFCELCEEKKATLKRGLLFWQEALDNIERYKDDAEEKSKYQFAKDDLNEWILQHYDVMSLPNRFWNVVADLENGVYNNKKCKPVSVELLLNTWRWGQRNLDKINRRNKMHNKGPKDDAQRVNYDLSVIISHVPDYLKAKTKREAEEAERQARMQERVKVNYKNLSYTQIQVDGLDDISALLDEI